MSLINNYHLLILFCELIVKIIFFRALFFLNLFNKKALATLPPPSFLLRHNMVKIHFTTFCEAFDVILLCQLKLPNQLFYAIKFHCNLVRTFHHICTLFEFTETYKCFHNLHCDFQGSYVIFSIYHIYCW